MLNLNVFQKYAMPEGAMTKVSPQLFTRIALFGAVCFALLVWFFSARLPVLYQQEVELPVRYGVMKGTLWLPASSLEKPVPAVVLVHGMASSRRTMQGLAKRLAYQEIAAFVPDLRGYGESVSGGSAPRNAWDYTEDVQESLSFLRTHPAIAERTLAVVGHSLGASIVATLPPSPLLRIALSMHAQAPASGSLQWWTGLYDPLHPPYLARFQYVSPCASHGTAPEDLCVHKHLLKTLAQSLGTVPDHGRLLASEGLRLSLLGLGVSLLALWVWGPLAPGGYPLVLMTLAAALPFLMGGYFRWLYAPYCGTALVILMGGYLLRQGRAWTGGKTLLYGLGLAYLAHLSASVLRGIVALLATAQPLLDLRYLPLFLFQSVTYLPVWLHEKSLTLLFQQQYARLEPSWVFWLFWAVELLSPGAWGRGLESVVSFCKVLRQPVASRFDGRRLGVLVLLLGALLGVWVWRAGQGYLSIKILQNLMPLTGGVIVPDLLIFWLYYRVCLKKCPRDDSNIRPTV